MSHGHTSGHGLKSRKRYSGVVGIYLEWDKCLQKHTHTHTHIYIYIYIYVYMYIYVYTLLRTLKGIRGKEGDTDTRIALTGE